jgi:hypothetical protein
MGTRAEGGGNLGGGASWEYVYATATLTTGKFVYINTAGTAVAVSTANFAASTAGLKLGVTQFLMSAGEYGFVATYGGPIYIRCSGTVPPTVAVGMADSAGVITTAGLVAATATAGGVFITTSASTAGQSVAQGMVTYPRPVAATSAPLG